MIRDLSAGGRVVARVLEAPESFGVEAASSADAPLQVLSMRREKGYRVAKHGHAPHVRETTSRQKALVVMSGAIDVVVCDDKGVDGDTCRLLPGQCLFLIEGGYTLTFAEDTTFYEFKNGPHTDDKIAL